MKMETVKVAITRVEGPVAIMDLIVVGCGSVLPAGAVWVDEREGWWRREPTSEVIEKQIERGASYLGQVTGWELVGETEIPVDRTFRDAWRRQNGKIEVDMPTARKIHLDRVRVARAPKLAALDGEWMRAMGQKNAAEADKVETDRQALRDLPDTLAVDTAATPEALAAMWPKELE